MDKARNEKKKFLFTVDILMEGYNNGIALENLLHLLNQDKILDYDIRKGISLGEQVASALKQPSREIPVPPKASSRTTGKPDKEKEDAGVSSSGEPARNAEPPKTAPSGKSESGAARSNAGPGLIQLVEKYKASNALVRLTVLKGKGIRLSLPCRVLNFDPDTDTLTVYHVDEKKVYQFRMTEVEDFSV